MGFAVKRPDTAFSLDQSGKATKRIEDAAHLAFIRKLPSAVSGAYGCEACHIRAGSAIYRKKHTGGQQKPDDFWTVPLTPDEHRRQHSGEELAWWSYHCINPFQIAADLYEVSGNIEAGTAIILKALKARTP